MHQWGRGGEAAERLQYHMKIGPWWGIPMHHGCRCRQVAIAPGALAPHEFVDYRALLDRMPAPQQKAAVGASCWRLIESGTVEWKDVVTSARVRTLREVVSLRKLTVEEMVEHGVAPVIARRAYETVHTAAHEIAAEERKKLEANITAAGLPQKALAEELARGISQRVSIGPGLTGTEHWMKTAGRRSADELAKLLERHGGGGPPAGGAPPAPRPAPKPKPGPKPGGAALPLSPALPIARHGKTDERDVDNVARSLARLPSPVLKALAAHGVGVALAGKVSDYNARDAGEHARGWGPYSTLQNASAFYKEKEKTIVAAVTYKLGGGYQPSPRLGAAVRHEAGHAFDLLFGLSRRAEFVAAYNRDVAALSREQRDAVAYLLQPGDAGREEAFAEVFAAMHGGGAIGNVDAAEIFENCARAIVEHERRGGP